ncbi:MAG: hypothetical protein IT204_01840 [Fimbriimonadaceae bacterium]|nr:hypothetical protein [Fimbriimonadaceae bacterium]
MSEQTAPTTYQRGTHRDAGRLIGCLLRLFVLLAIGGVVAACGLFFYLRAHPEKLLEKLLPTTPLAQAQVTASYTIDMQMGTFNTKSTHDISLAYARPNLLHAKFGSGMSQVVVNSDGQQLHLDLLNGQMVVRCPAPPDFAKVADDPAWRKLGAKLPAPAAVGGKGNWRDAISKIEFGIDRGSEWMKTLAAPLGSKALTVTSKDGGVVTVWIDPRRAKLTQAAMDITPERLQAQMAKAQPGGKLPGGGAAPNLGQMHTRHLLKVSQFDLQQRPDPSKFKYRPPAGARVTQAKSLAELPTALMGMARGGMR